MSASARHSAIVSQGRAVESWTSRGSGRPLGGVAGDGESVVNGSGMLAPMLSAFHFLTHIGLSRILANLWPATRRDRWLIVLGGTLLDLDGAGIVWSQAAYQAAHRAAGHGLVFCLLLLAITLAVADARWRTAALVAMSFHLHLLLDAIGTGGLPIRYLWPFSERVWS